MITKENFSLFDYREMGLDYCEDWSNSNITPKQAIMAKCFECCAWDIGEVKKCENKRCPLFAFKEKYMPHSIYKKKELSEEEKQIKREMFLKNLNK